MPESATLLCPSCGSRTEVEAGAVSARCPVCHSPAGPRAAARDSLDGAVLLGDGRLAPAPRAPVPLPAGLTISTDGGELRMERRWYTWVALLAAFFCVMWLGVFVFWYLLVYMHPSRAVSLLALLHAGSGLILVYATVALFINRTLIVVNGADVTIRHGPLPWLGNRDIPAAGVEQLHCERHVTRTRGGTTITYSVLARAADGRATTLVRGLSERDQAHYIEQQIEHYLGITDQPLAPDQPRTS
ncbi:MAG TPA: hypothetical protein VE913_05770 [Longimicrobium sp.]|nr:hypothetical protein [Longimicrobium sp.]